MSKKTYDEQLALFKGFEAAEEKSEKTIVKIYAKKLITYKQYMGQLFENYEEDGKLTYDEMIIYGRLAKMDATLRGLTVSLYSESTKEITSALTSAYTTGFDGTSEIISRAWGKKSLIPIIKEEEMHRALTNEISGLKWTDRMDIHRDHAAAKIRETIVRGLYEGESYAQMAKRLETALGKDVPNAIGIVRTESSRVFSQARKDRLDKVKGADMTKEWITSADERVRSNHVSMHGVKIPYNNDFILPNGNGGFGPGLIGTAADDINCRCFWVIDFADESEGQLWIPDELSDEYKIGNTGEASDNFNIDEALNELRAGSEGIPAGKLRSIYEAQIDNPETFIVNMDSSTAMRYNPGDGKIHINPIHQSFAEYDIRQGLSHEIGHKIDREMMQCYSNKVYMDAVQSAASQVMDNLPYYSTLFEDATIYDNMSVSDIVNALSKDKIRGAFIHPLHYWERAGAVEVEIFADIFTAEVTNDITALTLIQNEFPALLKAFRSFF